MVETVLCLALDSRVFDVIMVLGKRQAETVKITKETLKEGFTGEFMGTEELDSEWDWCDLEGDKWDEYCGIKKGKF
jgi:hypothetical protein